MVPGDVFGGLQKLAGELVAAQRRQGVDASLLSLYRDPAVLSYCEERGLPLVMTRGPSRNPQAWWDFARALRHAAPDIVHLHTGVLWSNAFGLALKSCPWVYHAHGYFGIGFKARAQRLVLPRLCEAYIGITESVSDAVRGFVGPQARVVTIPNGLPLPPREAMRRPRVNDSSVRRYGMATRFAPDKGVLEFLDVAAEIAKWDPQARFILAGDGELAVAARERAHALGLADKLEMPGFVTDMDAFWPTLDVALFTAAWEPFGLRIIEPMAFGVPVVAYRTGAGSDELMDNGRTALMAPWGNPTELAAQCVRLMRDAALTEDVRQAARQQVEENYSVETMVRRVEALYSAIPGSVAHGDGE